MVGDTDYERNKYIPSALCNLNTNRMCVHAVVVFEELKCRDMQWLNARWGSGYDQLYLKDHQVVRRILKHEINWLQMWDEA